MVQMLNPLLTFLRHLIFGRLGLKFRLYSCEILFNRGLSSIYMVRIYLYYFNHNPRLKFDHQGNQPDGMKDLGDASKEKQTDEHSVIDEAIRDLGDGYTVFSIPVGVLYRPPESKLKNLAAKNYLGTSKLVAATDTRDAFTGFTGAVKAERAKVNSDAKEEKAALLQRSNTAVGARRANDEVGAAPPPQMKRSNTVAGGGRTGRGEAGSSLPESGVGLRGRSNSARQPGGGGGGGQTPTINLEKASLPSPPASEELPLNNKPNKSSSPPQFQSSTQPSLRPDSSAYPDLVDTYYADEDAPPLPPVPNNLLPLSAGRNGPVPEGQPLDRVANWARQTSARGGLGLSRNPSANSSLSGGVIGGAPLTRVKSSGQRTYISNNTGARRDNFSPRSFEDDDGQYSQTVMTEVEMSKVRLVAFLLFFVAVWVWVWIGVDEFLFCFRSTLQSQVEA